MRDTQVTQASVQSTIQESTSIYQQSLSASEVCSMYLFYSSFLDYRIDHSTCGHGRL